MEGYIESIRKSGYVGFIQVVKIVLKQAGNLVFEVFYDFSKELSQQVDLKKYTLSAFGSFFDVEKRLEILFLEFDTVASVISEYEKHENFFFQKPYWAELRKFIGHSVVYSSSCVIIIEKDDKILSVKRTDDGMWSLPAGAKELGDGLEKTIRLEALEEVGVNLYDLQLIAIQSGQKMFWKYPNENEMHYISFVWKGKTLDLPKISDGENTEIRWMDFLEAKKSFEPRWSKRLDYFLKFNGSLIID